MPDDDRPEVRNWTVYRDDDAGELRLTYLNGLPKVGEFRFRRFFALTAREVADQLVERARADLAAAEALRARLEGGGP